MTRIAGVVMVLSLGVVGCGDDLEYESCQASEEATAADTSPAQCASPAPLSGLINPCAPGYIVQYQPGVDAEAETRRLSALHGFQPASVYKGGFSGFHAELGVELREALRCEASVLVVGYNGIVRGTD